MQRGLVVAVHSAAGKRACGGNDVAACQQTGPGVTIITFAAVVADGLQRVRVSRLTRMRGSAR
jgi:hypothetical protein